MKRMTRRELFGRTGRLAGAISVGLPLLGSTSAGEPAANRAKLRVVVAGAHPDDPETGCGGTIARYSDLGHEVTVIYLTRGEAGIAGKTHQEAAAIRSAEAQRACEILKAKALFAGQIDAATEVSPARYDEFRTVLESEKPDLVFTHWPLDTHRDHRAISVLVNDAWLRQGRKFGLYYFEVLTGEQTSHFWPTHYVDIAQTEPRKRAACFAHASQGPEEFYPYHEKMNVFRGMECGCKYAEAFIRHVQGPDTALPLTG